MAVEKQAASKSLSRRQELQAKSPVRVYKGEIEVDSDVFKLEVANVQINKGLSNKPRWVPTEHAHFFHSYDSNGKKMMKCNSVAGHTHLIEVIYQDDGTITAKCGPAVKEVKKGEFQEIVLQTSRNGSNQLDDHVHDVTYLFSERIMSRKMNIQAKNFIANYNDISNVKTNLE